MDDNISMVNILFTYRTICIKDVMKNIKYLLWLLKINVLIYSIEFIYSSTNNVYK